MAPEGTAAVVEQPVAPAPHGAAPESKTSPDAGGKPAASQPEPKWEDDPRVKGMLADLKKEREARQAHERKLAELDGTLKEERRRIAALAGITTPSKQETDTASIRARLAEVYPELAELGSISDIKNALEEQQVQGYASHSRNMIAKIHAGIAAEYGDLTDSQKRRINAAYLYENQNNPEVHARHNAGDPTLIDEFVKGWLTDVADPIKRKMTAAEATRFRAVPGGRDRSTPVRGEKPKTGEDMLRAHYREKAR